MQAHTRLPDRARRAPWRALGAALLAAGPLFGGLAAASAGAQESGLAGGVRPEDEESRGLFSLPNTRGAQALATRIEEHVQAQRWSEALHSLQRMLEEHGRDVLSPAWRDPDLPVSRYANYPGAAEWAQRRLRSLPLEALELYGERHAQESTLAFELARAAGDRRALAVVAQRWPAAPAAERAWWTLGDLELESGNLPEALRAWARARDLRELLQLGEAAGVAARLSFADELGGDGAGALSARERGGQVHAELRLPGPGEGGGPVPREEADSWFRRLPPEPMGGEYNLFAVSSGGSLLVSNSMELVCLDIHRGSLIWSSGEPAGWERKSPGERQGYWTGLDRELSLFAPAVSQGVAVAALQLPWAALPNTDYQGIDILTSIPERRLHAFDLATGRQLWNHAPLLLAGWDGESGGPAQRLNVAGPPVVAGSRLLVPCYQMRGRINFYACCYDLFSGELLWSTSLVSGQSSTNMFGRHQVEFASAPLRVEGDRVLALSQLGTVAALDLFTGHILWESMYEQIELPRTHHYEPAERPRHWRNAPPVVADGCVIATPLDSEMIVGYDLETGTTLWAHSNRVLTSALRGYDQVNVLLGADRDTVYLGGDVVLALTKPGSLRSPNPFSRRWSQPYQRPDRAPRMYQRPRALLGEETILVPTRDELVVLDRASGQPDPARSFPWGSSARGNLLLAGGAIFSVGRQVHGYFDWDVLLNRVRAHLEQRPGSRELELELAGLLLRRGESLLEDDRPAEALTFLVEARERLTERLGSDPRQLDNELYSSLHQVLRGEAQGALELGRRAESLERLDQARRYVSNTEELRDTLLAREALLRTTDAGAWLQALDELEQRCASLPVPEEYVRFVSDPVLEGLLIGSGLSEHEQRASLAGALSVGLWVHIERSRAHALAGRPAAELGDLHAILARWSGIELAPGVSAGELARRRIAECLEGGGREAYAAFEAQADAALVAATAERDRAALATLSRNWPHSDAARRARAQRLEWAYLDGDVTAVALAAQESLGLESATPLAAETALQLLRLAELMGRRGNLAYQRGLLERLAAAWPELGSDIPEHGGLTLEQLLAALPARQSAPPPIERSHFDQSIRIAHSEYPRGGLALLGELRAPAGSPARAQPLLLGRGDRLEAWSTAAPHAPRWSLGLDLYARPEFWADRIAICAGRTVVVTEYDILGFDSESGGEVWRWEAGSLDPAPVEHLTAAQGVALALLPQPGERVRVQALDVQGGLELWQLGLEARRAQQVVVGEGRAVFFGHRFGRAVQATVVDLFTGRILGELDLGEDLRSLSYEPRFWIENGLLVLPSFMGSAPYNHVSAWDLERLERAWKAEFSHNEDLYAIARSQGETYLYLRSSSLEAPSGGSISSLKVTPTSGSLTQIMPLVLGEEPIGLRPGRVTELPGPYLFVARRVPLARNVPITAILLPYGKRWVHPLDVRSDEFSIRAMPVPAVSETTVALAYSTTSAPGALDQRAHLVLLDRVTGTRRGERQLEPNLANADELTLLGLGDSVFIVGHGRTRSPQLQIWSNAR